MYTLSLSINNSNNLTSTRMKAYQSMIKNNKLNQKNQKNISKSVQNNKSINLSQNYHYKYSNKNLQDFLKDLIVNKKKKKNSTNEEKQIIKGLNNTWFQMTDSYFKTKDMVCSLGIKKNQNLHISKKFKPNLQIKQELNEQSAQIFSQTQYIPTQSFPKRRGKHFVVGQFGSERKCINNKRQSVEKRDDLTKNWESLGVRPLTAMVQNYNYSSSKIRPRTSTIKGSFMMIQEEEKQKKQKEIQCNLLQTRKAILHK